MSPPRRVLGNADPSCTRRVHQWVTAPQTLLVQTRSAGGVSVGLVRVHGRVPATLVSSTRGSWSSHPPAQKKSKTCTGSGKTAVDRSLVPLKPRRRPVWRADGRRKVCVCAYTYMKGLLGAERSIKVIRQ